MTPAISMSAPSSSSKSISIDEQVRNEDVPASGIVGSQVTATDVAKDDSIPSQQTHTGCPLSIECFSSTASFVLFSFIYFTFLFSFSFLLFLF